MTKNYLPFDQAADYCGLSKSYLYKLTFNKRIPHFKPGGKLIYFSVSDLDRWITSNRVSTTDEITEQAQAYCLKNKMN